MKPPPQPRLAPRDGALRIEMRGAPGIRFADVYHFLLKLTWPRFIGLMISGYLLVNLAFAGLYVMGGDVIANARAGSFADAFFLACRPWRPSAMAPCIPEPPTPTSW
ncbi:MAG: Inward rectifier potassium channel Kirbac3.1 [Myxococcota bacterium]|nr:Inward rectifier potassium channel Kirbac3.1 [Myxococcota bacterium]